MPPDLRAREILHLIVEEYLSSGEPVGSRTLSRRLESSISPATIRNIMASLTEADLIYSPHTSAGRKPTQQGLRFYVDSLMQSGELSPTERLHIEESCKNKGSNLRDIYDNASLVLSSMSSYVGIVLAPKIHKPISQIQFMKLEADKILAIMVPRDGMVENRIITVPGNVTRDMLDQASNYLNERIAGHTVGEVRDIISQDIHHSEGKLQQLMSVLVQEGVIDPMSSTDDDYIFMHGKSRLLNEGTTKNIDEMRNLLSALEEHKNMIDMLDAVRDGEGVQILLGTFGNDNLSTIIKPYRDRDGRIIGATGVIGPTRVNYKRIVPIVNHTAQVMEKVLGMSSYEKT